MLAYLVTSKARRLLLELLWRNGVTGTASELAKRSRVSFAGAYRELKLMETFGLATTQVVDGREVYSAATGHPDAELLRQLVGSKSQSTAPSDEWSKATRARVKSLGAPLPVEAQSVESAEHEQVVVDAIRLSRRDATLARVLPVVLWRQRHQLDRKRLEDCARGDREAHAVGFFLALTAELAGDASMGTWAEELRDHRARGTRSFFQLPSAHTSRDLAARRTPDVARRWGFLMDMDLDSFKTQFEKFARGDSA